MAPRKNVDAEPSAGLTPQENKFIKTMFDNMKSRPDADWDKVAEQMTLKDAKCAKERFRQIALRHGWNSKSESSSPAGSPSKVTKKPATPRKKPATPRKKKQEEKNNDEEMKDEDEHNAVKNEATGAMAQVKAEDSGTEEESIKDEETTN